MDNHMSPPPMFIAAANSTANSTGNSTVNRALENFKKLLMDCAIASTPTQSLSDPHAMFIKQRIQLLVPEFPTPYHPPYASMIENAIKQMNMESGSSEEAISKFILEEYKGLPLAHSTLLEHHLGKLCECGELVQSLDGCYLFGKETTGSRPASSVTSHSHSSSFCNSNLEYESTSTSGSTKIISLKRKRKMRNCKRKKNKLGKQKATSIRNTLKSKVTLGRGWDQGQGRGRTRRGKGRVKSLCWPCEENIIDRANDATAGQEENNVSTDNTTETPNLVLEHEVGSENTKKQSQDPVNVQSNIEHSSMVKEIESSRQEEMMKDTSSQSSTSEQGQGRTRSDKGLEKSLGWPCKENIIDRANDATAGQEEKNVSTDNTTETPNLVLEHEEVGSENIQKQSLNPFNVQSNIEHSTMVKEIESLRQEEMMKDTSSQSSTSEQDQGQGRTRSGKGLEKSLGWPCKENIIDRANDAIVSQEENNVSTNDTTEIPNLVVEHEVASENIQKQSQDPFDVQSHIEHSTMVKEIASSREEEMMKDTSSQPSTSEQGQGRKLGRQLMKDLQMVETGKNTEPVEAATDMGKDRLEMDQESQTRKCVGSCPNVEAIQIDDINMVPERLTSDFPKAFEGNMMDEDIMDELVDEVYMEITQETKHLNFIDLVAQLSPEEQNHAEGNNLVVRIIQLSESENENEDDGIKGHTQLIQLSESENDNEDDGVKGHTQLNTQLIQLSESENEEDGVKVHTHTSELQDEISEKSVANQTTEIGNICLDEHQQIEPTMDLSEPQTHDYLGIEIQQVEIIGHRNLCKENCPITEEENYLKYASEVLDEQGQHIKLPESITEQNQHEELDCILTNGEKTNSKEFEHFDELKKPDNEIIEKKKQPYTEHGEGQSQQLEEPNQQGLRAKLDQQTESSNGMEGKMLSSESFSKVKIVDDSSAIGFPLERCIEQNENSSQQSEEQRAELDQQTESSNGMGGKILSSETFSKVKLVDDSSAIHFPPKCYIEQNANNSQQSEKQNQVLRAELDQQAESSNGVEGKILSSQTFSNVKLVDDLSAIHFPPKCYIEQNENNSQQSEEQNQELETSRQIELSKIKSVEVLSNSRFPPKLCIEQNETQSPQEEQNQEVEMIGNDQQKILPKFKSVEDSSTVLFSSHLYIEYNENQCQELEEKCQEVEMTEDDSKILSKSNSVEDSSTVDFPPQPNTKQKENQSQQLEEQNQNVEMTEKDQSGNDQQKYLSEGMRAEISTQETFSEDKSEENSSIVYILTPIENATDNPYCQKLRPRHTKIILDQEEEQPSTPGVQKSNNLKKPKSRPSKSESVEDSKRKQEGQAPRRSIRLQSVGREI